jgi:hypothetical protein
MELPTSIVACDDDYQKQMFHPFRPSGKCDNEIAEPDSGAAYKYVAAAV